MIGNIVLDSEVMDTMDSDCSIECVMNRIVLNVRAVNSSNHMEMNGVATKNEGLANISQLNTINASRSRLITRAMHDYDGTILVIR